MIIVGSGMAGLLAARMLSHRKPIVWERQTSLPNNHSAVLRFRTSQVGDILGIPFKKVHMIKDALPWQNPIADALAYSYKNTGVYRSDRSIRTGPESAERFIAPPDLISRMAEGVKIEFGREYDPNDPHTRGAAVISTVPMPALMDILDYEFTPDFQYRSGAVVTALVKDCDAYVSILDPRPDNAISRISITGNALIVELPFPGGEGASEWAKSIDQYSVASIAANVIGVKSEALFGVSAARLQQYNKIVPIRDEHRKDFMFWATTHHSVYSLGRFATWRPGLLLDDLVQDIRLIDKWMGSSGYDRALHAGR